MGKYIILFFLNSRKQGSITLRFGPDHATLACPSHPQHESSATQPVWVPAKGRVVASSSLIPGRCPLSSSLLLTLSGFSPPSPLLSVPLRPLSLWTKPAAPRPPPNPAAAHVLRPPWSISGATTSASSGPSQDRPTFRPTCWASVPIHTARQPRTVSPCGFG